MKERKAGNGGVLATMVEYIKTTETRRQIVKKTWSSDLHGVPVNNLSARCNIHFNERATN